MWVRPAVHDDQVRFLVDGVTADDGYEMYGRDQFTMAERATAGTSRGYAKAPTLPLEGFTHVVVTFGESRIEMFVDGTRYVKLTFQPDVLRVCLNPYITTDSQNHKRSSAVLHNYTKTLKRVSVLHFRAACGL